MFQKYFLNTNTPNEMYHPHQSIRVFLLTTLFVFGENVVVEIYVNEKIFFPQYYIFSLISIVFWILFILSKIFLELWYKIKKNKWKNTLPKYQK